MFLHSALSVERLGINQSWRIMKKPKQTESVSLFTKAAIHLIAAFTYGAMAYAKTKSSVKNFRSPRGENLCLDNKHKRKTSRGNNARSNKLDKTNNRHTERKIKRKK